MSASSVPSRIPSPSSFASSPISPASELSPDSLPYVFTRDSHPYLFAPSLAGLFKPRLSYRRHSRYYFSDGNIIFLVDGTLYNVHRYFFQRDSSNFASMFTTIPHGGSGKGLTDDEPIVLPRVAAKDFDLFLSILYPSDFGVYTATTVAEWTAILDLAANWNFKSIKALAIRNLVCIASPIDKIVLGRKHDIEEWLGGAYEAVCIRDEPLTLEDGMRLGMEDVIKISAARQRIHRQPACLPSALTNFIRQTFGLELLHIQEVTPHVGQGEKVNISAPEGTSLSCRPPAISLTEVGRDGPDVGKEQQPPPPGKPLTKAQKMKAKREAAKREAAEWEAAKREAAEMDAAVAEWEAKREMAERNMAEREAQIGMAEWEAEREEAEYGPLSTSTLCHP